MKKAVSFILAIIIATGALPFTGLTAFAENTELTSGSCGENATYSFDSGTGTLTISGTGEMTTYSSSSQSPFSNHSEINALVVESGITSISDFAFVYCTGMESVSFPNTLEKIG
ncbi:MAG: leucine-rich repeat protein, partial [Eubacterium sp.]|nr:leucine-rich repeat protein [Eubacterium sp.]